MYPVLGAYTSFAFHNTSTQFGPGPALKRCNPLTFAVNARICVFAMPAKDYLLHARQHGESVQLAMNLDQGPTLRRLTIDLMAFSPPGHVEALTLIHHTESGGATCIPTCNRFQAAILGTGTSCDTDTSCAAILSPDCVSGSNPESNTNSHAQPSASRYQLMHAVFLFVSLFVRDEWATDGFDLTQAKEGKKRTGTGCA